MENEIDRFEARADDGTIYVVVAIQEYADASSMARPNQWIEGFKRLELLDGAPVNYINAETFKIVASGEIIRKVG